MFKSVVLNFSSNPKRRLEFTIPLDVEESIRHVQEIALDAIRAIDGVASDPGPSWTVDAYDAGGITLRFFAWVDQRQCDLGKVRSEAIHAVRTAWPTGGADAGNIIPTAVAEQPGARTRIRIPRGRGRHASTATSTPPGGEQRATRAKTLPEDTRGRASPR